MPSITHHPYTLPRAKARCRDSNVPAGTASKRSPHNMGTASVVFRMLRTCTRHYSKAAKTNPTIKTITMYITRNNSNVLVNESGGSIVSIFYPRILRCILCRYTTRNHLCHYPSEGATECNRVRDKTCIQPVVLGVRQPCRGRRLHPLA